ncbi:MAG: 1-deoxy-D-xylulose-5-phosphate reductoisomerase [Bacteroidales bacterium]|jgi:1-deoxy-D-xylulose-5-phosphate reductoisomerase|nr:1-deoxy-D-xylulose-5-phosphate reductoisomerase [Bacteroidales bacterium]
MADKKHIAILGSTGSIGTQCLDVIRNHKDKFVAEVLVAGNNEQLLIEQALEFQPNMVVIANEDKYQVVADALQDKDIKVFAGESSIDHVVQISSVNMVLTAMVGFAGLKPTLKAIEAGKPIALANKETLVVAGDLIMKAVQKYRVPLIPVDSEHSALFQCLNGEPMGTIKKLILTASGGPFRNKTADELKEVSLEQALNHPNWDMGPKVTIDSASMMNKGLEVIEAYWLFGIPADKIEVVIHPQSIVHSMVEFIDGSMKAQLGNTDMRLPIQYALSWPNRIETHVEPISLTEIGKLEFEAPDTTRFPNLKLAFEALKKGGNAACVLNAANEIAVQAFLDKKIRFTDIAFVNEQVMNAVEFHKSGTIEDYIESDKTAREKAVEQINTLKL